MTHIVVREWQRVAVGDAGFRRAEADLLLAAAQSHPKGGRDGTAILTDHHRYLRAQQMVGVLSAPGCSLEILPKVDAEASDETETTVRARLVDMLDVALGLSLHASDPARMARQSTTLLDILIRLFAERLIAETRRGLPRRYVAREEDLGALRGRLDPVPQFTRLAVRPDRLACRFDDLTANSPLMQIMKATVVFLSRHAQASETRRLLAELRLVLAEIDDVAPRRLPWSRVRIDRTNRRWQSLLDLARLFLERAWQATHLDPARAGGVTLLFPMNDLFEAYVAALTRKALVPLGFDVTAQGGRRYCLGDWSPERRTDGRYFRTRPDILIRRGGNVASIIDTKWKALPADPLDVRRGVAQSDIYQMMAYARLYQCSDLILLYPASGTSTGRPTRFGITAGREQLAISTVDVREHRDSVMAQIRSLMRTPTPRASG